MSTNGVRVGIRPGEWVSGDRNRAGATLEWVTAAEELGFDGVFAGDRLLEQAKQGDTVVYGSTLPEVLTSLAAFAGRTRRLRLAPLVLIVPYRHPVFLAKTIATLDALSGGRVILPVGGGWNQREFDLLGIPLREVGPRLEESLEIMKRLWTTDNVSYAGRYFTLDGISVAPKPAQAGGPPIWFGSFSPGDPRIMGSQTGFTAGVERALARVGRLGDGWVPLTYSATAYTCLDPVLMAQAWERIKAAARAAGRDPGRIAIAYSHWYYVVESAQDRRDCEQALRPFFQGSYEDAVKTYLIGTPEEILAKIERLTRTLERVDWFIFTAMSLAVPQMERLAKAVVPHLAKLGRRSA